MKTKNKLLILFMCLVILLPLSHPMVANGWDYSGTGSGGGAASGSGIWNSWVMGVRATAVDKNGKRLSVKVGNTTYESRSIDYYGTSAYFGTYVIPSDEHSVCTMSTGATTLCSKPDLGSGGSDCEYAFDDLKKHYPNLNFVSAKRFNGMENDEDYINFVQK